jgi:hypothetical protein
MRIAPLVTAREAHDRVIVDHKGFNVVTVIPG